MRNTLDNQSKKVIQDANELKKSAAVENMKNAYDREQTLEAEQNWRKQQQYKNDLMETKKVQQLQMESKNLASKGSKMHEEKYRKYIDETVGLLSNRDKEESDKRKKLQNDYAKELWTQMGE